MPTSAKTEKHPRALIQRLYESIKPVLAYSNTHFVGGSFVRGCPTCGDLDIAVLQPAGYFDEEFKSLGTVLSYGETVKRIVIPFEGKDIQVDVWATANSGNWGPLCMFVAGSGKLNMIQRANATRRGYTLGFSLKDKALGIEIPLPTEQDVYKFLKWPWLPYSERNL